MQMRSLSEWDGVQSEVAKQRTLDGKVESTAPTMVRQQNRNDPLLGTGFNDKKQDVKLLVLLCWNSHFICTSDRRIRRHLGYFRHHADTNGLYQELHKHNDYLAVFVCKNIHGEVQWYSIDGQWARDDGDVGVVAWWKYSIKGARTQFMISFKFTHFIQSAPSVAFTIEVAQCSCCVE